MTLHEALGGRRLLIFDFDGTLADTSSLHAAAFAQVLAPLGVRVNYATIAGMKTRDAVRRCLLDADISVPDAEAEALSIAKQSAVRELIRVHLRPLPRVPEFIGWAYGRFQLAIASSGSRQTVHLALSHLGMSCCFDPVVCGEDVIAGKPTAEPFLRVLAQTGIAAKEALVFEDSEAGFAAARAAGIDCIDVSRPEWNWWSSELSAHENCE